MLIKFTYLKIQLNLTWPVVSSYSNVGPFGHQSTDVLSPLWSDLLFCLFFVCFFYYFIHLKVKWNWEQGTKNSTWNALCSFFCSSTWQMMQIISPQNCDWAHLSVNEVILCKLTKWICSKINKIKLQMKPGLDRVAADDVPSSGAVKLSATCWTNVHHEKWKITGEALGPTPLWRLRSAGAKKKKRKNVVESTQQVK